MRSATTKFRSLLFAILTVLSVSCDQGTKSWARRTLPGSGDVSVIDGYFDFHLAQNTGAAFSLLHNVAAGRVLLVGIGLVLLAGLFWWLRRTIHEGTLPVAALGLIAGGAIGNLIDRVWLGSVTDFIYWHTRTLRWPVFNIADVVLVVGVAMLVLTSGRKAGTDPSSEATR